MHFDIDEDSGIEVLNTNLGLVDHINVFWECYESTVF